MSPDRNESQLRELRAAVERAFAVPVPEPDHPGYGQETESRPDPADGKPTLQFKVGTQLKDIECKVIVATLDYCHGRKPETARLLGVSLKTLYNRLNQYHQMRS